MNASFTSVDPHAQTLLDMPTEVLATICAFCDVPSKMVRPGPSVLHVVMSVCMVALHGDQALIWPVQFALWCSALRRHASACAPCWRNLLITLRCGES